MADKLIKVKSLTKTHVQMVAITDKPLCRGIESDSNRWGWWDKNGVWHRAAEVNGDNSLADVSANDHARAHSFSSSADHTSTITPGKIIVADVNGLPMGGTNVDEEVSSAVALSHNKARWHFGPANGPPAAQAVSETRFQFGYGSAHTVEIEVTNQNITLRPVASSKAQRGLSIVAGLIATDPGHDPLTLGETVNEMPRTLKIICPTDATKYGTIAAESTGYFRVTPPSGGRVKVDGILESENLVIGSGSGTVTAIKQFAVVEGTTAAGTATDNISLPSGMTSANCIAVAYYINTGYPTSQQNWEMIELGVGAIGTALIIGTAASANVFRIQYPSGYAGLPYRVAFMRIA